MEVLYRYEHKYTKESSEFLYGPPGVCTFDEPFVGFKGSFCWDPSELVCVKYPVTKTTKCGAWIELYASKKKKFVHLGMRKKYACEAKQEALLSFLYRKHAQKEMLRNQLEQVITLIHCAKKMAKEQNIYGHGWDKLWE